MIRGPFGRPGARSGPDAIRDAPRAYSYVDPYGRREETEGLFGIDVGDELLRGVTMSNCGNITIAPSDVLRNFDKLTKTVESVVEQGSFPVIIGGDHSIIFLQSTS